MENPSKYKSFPSDLLHKIKTRAAELKMQTQPLIAAFDADGTLWDCDLGEIFFDYLIQNNKVPLPPDPWDYYLSTKAKDPVKAYYWLAQIMASTPEGQVRNWAQDALTCHGPLPLLEPQKDLIQSLLKMGAHIYIVTASVKWAVEPGAQLLGLPASCVVGIETQVTDGLLSHIPIQPPTFKAGKAEALLKKTQGSKPFLCSGNSTGDTELLSCATDFAIAVSATPPGSELHNTEMALRQIAQTKGWITHQF